jgi:hypothetical protein
LGKRANFDRKAPVSPIISAIKNSPSPAFVLNPIVRKKSKESSFIFTTPLVESEKDFLKIEKVIKPKGKKAACEELNFEDLSFCNSFFHPAESTAIGSHYPNTFDNQHSFRNTDLSRTGKDFDESGKIRPIEIKNLIKMNPLYQLMCAYYDKKDCQPYVEVIDKDYEFQILNILFTYLQLTFKNQGEIDIKSKIILLLKSQPARPKKKQKIVQAIFTQIYKDLQERFEVNSKQTDEGENKTQNFFVHYFSEISINLPKIEAEFDIKNNIKNKNISYEFIEKTFKSKKFADDFVGSLKNEYIAHYRSVRFRKLGLMFAKWESFFLESQGETEVIEKIKKEVLGARFSLAWTDQELSSYFPFFYDLQTKVKHS